VRLQLDRIAEAQVVHQLRNRYAKVMSRQTAQLLEAFEALPEEEKRAFTVAFLRRAVPFDSGPLDDAETTAAADQLFASLEAEEHDAASR
jgi:hypothetical protein